MLLNTNSMQYLKIKSETQFLTQNVSYGCSCSKQFTHNTMQCNAIILDVFNTINCLLSWSFKC